MGTPQIIWFILAIIEIVYTVIHNGERRREKYNYAITIMGAIIEYFLLKWGGFFK